MNEALAADEDGNVDLEIARKENDSLKIIHINVTLNAEKKIGIFPKELIDYTSKQNTLVEAIQKSYKSIASNIAAFKRVFNGNMTRRVSGPIGIAKQPSFIYLLTFGFAGIFYALWNLLPLPKSALWEIVALVYEGVAKKTYPDAAFRISTNIGWFIIMAAMVWIFVNDLSRIL